MKGRVWRRDLEAVLRKERGPVGLVVAVIEVFIFTNVFLGGLCGVGRCGWLYSVYVDAFVTGSSWYCMIWI